MQLQKLTKPLKGMEYFRLRAGPKEAAALLKYNTANYREPSEQRVRYLSSAMVSGKWFCNPGDPLLLQRQGKTYIFLNGQHRLLAIVRSKCSVDLVLCILDADVPMQLTALDGQRPRNLQQFITYQGYSGSLCAPIARLLIAHDRTGKSSSQGPIDIQDGWETFCRYKDGILFVADLTKEKAAGVNAMYRTALTRGYYHYNRQRLREFHHQFTETLCPNPKTDRAATLLFRLYTEALDEGDIDRNVYYLRCERAVHAFGNCEHLTNKKQLKPETSPGALLPLS